MDLSSNNIIIFSYCNLECVLGGGWDGEVVNHQYKERKQKIPKVSVAFAKVNTMRRPNPECRRLLKAMGVPIIFYLPPLRPRFMLHLLSTQGLTQTDHILQGLRSRSPLASSASKWVCQWDFWHETRKQEDRCGFSFPLLCFIPDCIWRLYFFKSLAWDRWSLICESTTHWAL